MTVDVTKPEVNFYSWMLIDYLKIGVVIWYRFIPMFSVDFMIVLNGKNMFSLYLGCGSFFMVFLFT